MNRTAKFGIVLLVLLLVALGAYYLLVPFLQEKGMMSSSDAEGINETIKIGGDNYLGYFFVTSSEMRSQCRNSGIGISFTDDKGSYAERLKKFDDGEYDAIVLPVNSYLQHAEQYKFPGVVVAAISESKGADGIVGFTSRFPETKNINDAFNNSGLRIAYTGESPSSFLLDLVIADFGLTQLKNSKSWQVEVGGSEAVYEKAQQKGADAFVLWEPDLSKALKLPGMRYLWGSDKFHGYIIDVFVFRRKFVENNEQTLFNFLQAYFRTIDVYTSNRERMVEEMSDATDLDESVIETMSEKINWFGLEENARTQFGIVMGGGTATDGIINTISACTKVLVKTKRFDKDPLGGDWYKIVNSSAIRKLSESWGVASVGANVQKNVSFTALSEGQWKKLREVAVMQVDPITFQSWNNLLDGKGKECVDAVGQLLTTNYPAYRVIVRGHTGPGDEDENDRISLERAQTVMQYLTAVHNVDPNRVLAEGVGYRMPPLIEQGESQRQYRYRLSRVEFILVESNQGL